MSAFEHDPRAPSGPAPLDARLATLDRDQLVALVHQLAREEGTAFLISTHDPDIAASCRRIVHLVDGRVEPRPV